MLKLEPSNAGSIADMKANEISYDTTSAEVTTEEIKIDWTDRSAFNL